jgi:hypothetical protein
MCETAVVEYGLGRYISPSLRLDRPCLQRVFETILDHTDEQGRASGIQYILCMTMCMAGAFRSGSLQANHKKYIESGQVSGFVYA